MYLQTATQGALQYRLSMTSAGQARREVGSAWRIRIWKDRILSTKPMSRTMPRACASAQRQPLLAALRSSFACKQCHASAYCLRSTPCEDPSI